jgi:DNA-binding NtrC family response regulator
LRQFGTGGGYLVIGRILPIQRENSQPPLLLPERLMDVRQRWTSSFTYDLLNSGVPAMHRVLAQVRLASTVRAPVLLVGDPGTGKETIARIIHYQGPARERSFASLDCQRLPATVLWSVLSGESGAGHLLAIRAIGQPRDFNLGAIYLDEPGALPRDLQLRLCEWLAARSAKGEPDDAPRLLAGCSAPEEDVQAGRLLPDLFCLLGPLTVTVVPLRERRIDLPVLIDRMLAALNTEGERAVTGLTPAAWDVLHHHAWPGNLDELRQVLSDARSRTTSERIDAVDLPAALRRAQHLEQTPLAAAPRPIPLEKTLEQVEKRLIELALKRARGNRSRAAELLGIYRGRLLRRMEALGMGEQTEGQDS